MRTVEFDGWFLVSDDPDRVLGNLLGYVVAEGMCDLSRFEPDGGGWEGTGLWEERLGVFRAEWPRDFEVFAEELEGFSRSDEVWFVDADFFGEVTIAGDELRALLARARELFLEDNARRRPRLEIELDMPLAPVLRTLLQWAQSEPLTCAVDRRGNHTIEFCASAEEVGERRARWARDHYGVMCHFVSVHASSIHVGKWQKGDERRFECFVNTIVETWPCRVRDLNTGEELTGPPYPRAGTLDLAEMAPSRTEAPGRRPSAPALRSWWMNLVPPGLPELHFVITSDGADLLALTRDFDFAPFAEVRRADAPRDDLDFDANRFFVQPSGFEAVRAGRNLYALFGITVSARTLEIVQNYGDDQSALHQTSLALIRHLIRSGERLRWCAYGSDSGAGEVGEARSGTLDNLALLPSRPQPSEDPVERAWEAPGAASGGPGGGGVGIRSIRLEGEEHWEPGSWNPADQNMVVWVELEDGSRWNAQFFSYENVRSLAEENRRSGENLSGRYFWSDDMLLVDEVSRARIEEVVTHLVEREPDAFRAIFEREEGTHFEAQEAAFRSLAGREVSCWAASEESVRGAGAGPLQWSDPAAPALTLDRLDLHLAEGPVASVVAGVPFGLGRIDDLAPLPLVPDPGRAVRNRVLDELPTGRIDAAHVSADDVGNVREVRLRVGRHSISLRAGWLRARPDGTFHITEDDVSILVQLDGQRPGSDGK